MHCLSRSKIASQRQETPAAKRSISLNGPHSASLQALHRAIGNQAVMRLLQGEISISNPNDLKEKEAEKRSQDLKEDVICPAGQVTLHTDETAAQAAEGLGAQAFTFGSSIFFGRDRYQPGTPSGDKLLAHELTHASDHAASNAIYRSPDPAGDAGAELLEEIPLPEHALDPTNKSAWAMFELKSRREQFPKFYVATISAATGAYLNLQRTMGKSGVPKNDDQVSLFRSRFTTLVRLNALGLMAAHRASMEARRDEFLPALKKKESAGRGPSARSSRIATILEAAGKIQELNKIKSSLVDSRTQLNRASSHALKGLNADEVGDLLIDIRASIMPYIDDKATERYNATVINLSRMRSNLYAPAMWILAKDLVKWRQSQINEVARVLYQLYETFPFFAKADIDDILASTSEDQVAEQTQNAYRKLMVAIDEAIVEIGSGDIHPFDLPEAVKLTIEALPADLQKYARQAIAHHKVVEFWKTMGITALQAAIAFIPVVGPFIAAGIGVVQFGADLESMLDKSTLAASSNQPGKGMLGVEGPSTGEWAMMIAMAAMTIADLRAGVSIVRERSMPRPTQKFEYEKPPGKTLGESESMQARSKRPEAEPIPHKPATEPKAGIKAEPKIEQKPKLELIEKEMPAGAAKPKKAPKPKKEPKPKPKKEAKPKPGEKKHSTPKKPKAAKKKTEPMKSLDEQLADAQQDLNVARKRVVDYKKERLAAGEKQKGGPFKALYNAQERIWTLKRAKAYPNRQIIEQAEIVGVRNADGTMKTAKAIAGEGRTLDFVEIEGKKVLAGDLKSKDELIHSIEGGVKKPASIEGEFLEKSKIGAQHAKENKILQEAQKSKGKIVIRGKDVRTGQTVTIEVEAGDYASTVLIYEEIYPN